MMRNLLPTIIALAALAATPLAAQVALPGAPVGLPNPTGLVGSVTDRLDETLANVDRAVQREARRLLRIRERSLDRLLRQNSDLIERDARGDLARRGTVLVAGLPPAGLELLRNAGFRVLSSETIEGLDIAVTRLSVPAGLPLAQAETLAMRLVPEAAVNSDVLHFQAGEVKPSNRAAIVPITLQSSPRIGVEVGMIDGAPGPAIRTIGTKGFATGAPAASHHGSAVASLLQGAGVARIRVADIYGIDPAGGNALALARGLGWLVASGSKVVTISLVGPRNALVERAIARAQDKGVVIVAAVGNDGPAAPPAFPASYAGVVAITGVDGKKRALIEAGRALHLDYAAPGADIFGQNASGRRIKLRGTSYATPLAAARLAAALGRGSNWRPQLDNEARDLGPKGFDPTYGRGLLCGECARN